MRWLKRSEDGQVFGKYSVNPILVTRSYVFELTNVS